MFWLATRARERSEDATKALARARVEIRSNSDAREDKVQELEKVVMFVRCVTPRRTRRVFDEEKRLRATTRGGERFVTRDGVVVAVESEDDGKRERGRVASSVLSHEDAWKRQNALIDRQHFGRRLKKFIPEPL